MARVNTRDFTKTYRLGDFTEHETDVNSSNWTITHTLEVQKGQAEHLGRGQDATQDGAQGRLYGKLQTSTPTQITGQIRFTVRNLQLELVDIIAQFDLSEIDAGESSRGDRYPFPNQHGYEGYPYVLCVEVKATADQTISAADSTLKADGYRRQRLN